MRMNVIIWNKAKREMDFAYVWCGEYFGLAVADKYLANLQHDIELLSSFPEIGLREPLLEGKSISYRSLSVRPHFKLIYYVDEARAELHIVDFWDMRRDTTRLVDDLDV